MRDSLEITDAERSAYLASVLRLDPRYHVEEILRLRREFLDLPTAQSVIEDLQAEQHAETRRQASRKIAGLRKWFAKQKPKSVCKQLDRLQLEAFPDLQIAAHRLRIVAENSERLESLFGRREFNEEFRDQLLKILLASPQEAGDLKSQIVFWMSNAGSRHRMLNAIRLLKTEAPKVYELECDWFDVLLRVNVADARARASQKAPSESGSSGWRVVWVCVSLLLAVLRASSGCNGPSTPPRDVPRIENIRMPPQRNYMRPEDIEAARQFIEAHMKKQSQPQPPHDK